MSFGLRCCLCDARDGRVRDGHTLSLCASCYATNYWRSRQPGPRARVVSFYEERAGRAALVGMVRQ